MSDQKMPKEPLALMACKVVMRAHVSAAAKAAAAVLLDHVDWKSGTYRCDPSLGRICRLCRYARSNVQAGIGQLEALGVVRVVVHGGRYGRNQYDFDWDVIRRLDGEAQQALHLRRRRPPTEGVSNPDKGAQTLLQNPNQEPVPSRNKFLPHHGRPRTAEQTVRSQRSLSSAGKKGQARSDVARNSAERRWNADLAVRFLPDPTAYSAVVEAVDPKLMEEATDAELNRHGAGLELIVERLEPVLTLLLADQDLEEPSKSSGPPGPLATAGLSNPDSVPVSQTKVRVDEVDDG